MNKSYLMNEEELKSASNFCVEDVELTGLSAAFFLIIIIGK